MARATATETAERVEHLHGMILAGQSNTACLTFMRQTWGVSRAQGYRLIKRAWAQIRTTSIRAASTGTSCCRGQFRC